MNIHYIGYLFLVFPKGPIICRHHLDCPRYMYCHRILLDFGFCKHFPLKVLPIPIPI